MSAAFVAIIIADTTAFMEIENFQVARGLLERRLRSMAMRVRFVVAKESQRISDHQLRRTVFRVHLWCGWWFGLSGRSFSGVGSSMVVSGKHGCGDEVGFVWAW